MELERPPGRDKRYLIPHGISFHETMRGLGFLSRFRVNEPLRASWISTTDMLCLQDIPR